MKKILKAVLTAGADVIIAILAAVALLLGPLRVGRLLKAVSIPHFREHRVRTALTVFGISLGVAVLIAIVLVNRSINASFAETIDSVSGKADLQIATSSGGFDEAVMDQAREVEPVWRAAPLLMETALMRDPRAKGDRILILGVDLLGKDDDYFRKYDSEEMPEIKANPIGFLNSTSNIILSNKLAKQFGYKLHDKIPLATPQGVEQFDIWGFVDEEGVGRSFGGSVGIMYYQSAQAIFGRGTKIDKVDLKVRPGTDIAAAQKALKEKLGAGLDVDRPDRRNDRVNKLLGSLQTSLMLGSYIAVLVGAFLIYNTMSISVVQRRRELGILRALGSTKSSTLSLIAVEGLLLGIVGAIFGVGGGIALARVMLEGMSKSISEVFLQVAATKLHIDPVLIIGGFVLGVVSSVVSSFIPARQAMMLSPLETIKVRNMTRGRPRFDKITGADIGAMLCVLVAIGGLQVKPIHGVAVGAYTSIAGILMGGALISPRVIILVTRAVRGAMRPIFGVEGMMAAENLPRDINRIAITTSALMIGVAMATAFGAFVGSFKNSMEDWVRQSLPADLFITSAASTVGSKSVPMTGDLAEPLAKIEGVDQLERARIIDLDYKEQPVKLISTDMVSYLVRAKLKFQEGSLEEAREKALQGQMLISENLSRHLDLHKGQKITLTTPTGVKEFEICGVIIDYSSDRGSMIMDFPAFQRIWNDQLVDTYKLYLKDQNELEAVRRRVTEKYGEQYNLFVLTNAEVKQSVLKLVDQTFVVMNALQVVAMIIAVLGIINALLANVMDRIREIGVLRAVGMLRKRVRKLIMIEAGLIGLLSDLIGISIGLAAGWVLLTYINIVQTGWFFPFRPSWTDLAVTAVFVLVVSTAAGWYPARSAAKLDVTEALTYE